MEITRRGFLKFLGLTTLGLAACDKSIVENLKPADFAAQRRCPWAVADVPRLRAQLRAFDVSAHRRDRSTHR